MGSKLRCSAADACYGFVVFWTVTSAKAVVSSIRLCVIKLVMLWLPQAVVVCLVTIRECVVVAVPDVMGGVGSVHLGEAIDSS